MVRGAGRAVLAVVLRLLVSIGFYGRATAVGYRSRARRLARDAQVRFRRWGVWFELNLNDNVQRIFYYTGWYERPFLEFLRRELAAGDTYVDVGAHVGIDAAFAARLVPDGVVIAFEPVPETAQKLRASLGGLQNVEVVETALGAAAGRVTLRANPKWHPDDVSTRSRFGAGPAVCEAEVLRFDDWAASLGRIDVVKIDAEGSEFDVLQGMAQSLRGLRPRVVAIEMNAPYLRAAGTTEAEIVDFLKGLGYRREGTIGDNAIFRHEAYRPVPVTARRPTIPNPARHALRSALVPAGVSILALMVWFTKSVIVRGYSPIADALNLSVAGVLLATILCFVSCVAAAIPRLASRRLGEARPLAGFLPDTIVLLARLLRDDHLRWRHRLALLLLGGYVAMPLDAIPDFLPVVGQLDELFLIAFVLRWVVRSSGESIVRKHWPGPEASLRVLLRVAGCSTFH